MKRTIALTLAVLMAFFAAGCYNRNIPDGSRGRNYSGIYHDGFYDGVLRDQAPARDGYSRGTRSFGAGAYDGTFDGNSAFGGMNRGSMNRGSVNRGGINKGGRTVPTTPHAGTLEFVR
ncbi:MAG: hypothetical protein FWE32_05185 [Oscillospiraceae bacterium]|nr:hypothetical protein [Oscillospiraceae bacterium]